MILPATQFQQPNWRFTLAIMLSVACHIYLLINQDQKMIDIGSSSNSHQALAISFSQVQPVKQRSSETTKVPKQVIPEAGKAPAQVAQAADPEPLTIPSSMPEQKPTEEDIVIHEQLVSSIEPLNNDYQKNDTPVIFDPKYRRSPTPPNYPRRALRRNQQGTVLVRARITPLGDVAEVTVHQSSGYNLLDESALVAVNNWAFEPAYQNGEATEAWVQVPVNFKIR